MLKAATMWCHIRATGFGRTLARATSDRLQGKGREATASTARGDVAGGATNAAASVHRASQRGVPFTSGSVLMAALALGCSSLAPGDGTYAVEVAGLAGVGGSGSDDVLPPEWACLNAPAKSMPAAKSMLQVTGVVVDYRTHLPVSATLRACNFTDAACDPPGVAVGAQIPPLVPGGPPAVTVQVPMNFQGYLHLTADGYFPYDYYIGGPVTQDIVLTQPFTLVTQSSYIEFVSGMGVNPATAGMLGTLGLQILDCNQDPAPGVSLFLPDQASRPELQNVVAWASQNTIPVTTPDTDDAGTAGFVNLPLLNVSVEAVINGRHFGRRAFQMQPARLITGTVRAIGYENGY